MAAEFTMTREEIMVDLLMIKKSLALANYSVKLPEAITACDRLIRLETEYQAAIKAAMEKFKARPDGPNVA
jgi:hypothetical protein